MIGGLVLGALDAPLAVIEPEIERFRELMRRSLLSERKVETAMRSPASSQAVLS